jgi:hypothetical protein
MPSAKPGTRARIEKENRTTLNNLQERAVREGWYAGAYWWKDIDRLRKALGMKPVTHVDNPTAAHFR